MTFWLPSTEAAVAQVKEDTSSQGRVLSLVFSHRSTRNAGCGFASAAHPARASAVLVCLFLCKHVMFHRQLTLSALLLPRGGVTLRAVRQPYGHRWQRLFALPRSPSASIHCEAVEQPIPASALQIVLAAATIRSA
jgi:hypothetical protein